MDTRRPQEPSPLELSRNASGTSQCLTIRQFRGPGNPKLGGGSRPLEHFKQLRIKGSSADGGSKAQPAEESQPLHVCLRDTWVGSFWRRRCRTRPHKTLARSYSENVAVSCVTEES